VFFLLLICDSNRVQQDGSLFGCRRPALVEVGTVELHDVLFRQLAKFSAGERLSVMRAADRTLRRYLNEIIHTPSRCYIARFGANIATKNTAFKSPRKLRSRGALGSNSRLISRTF